MIVTSPSHFDYDKVTYPWNFTKSSKEGWNSPLFLWRLQYFYLTILNQSKIIFASWVITINFVDGKLLSRGYFKSRQSTKAKLDMFKNSSYWYYVWTRHKYRGSALAKQRHNSLICNWTTTNFRQRSCNQRFSCLKSFPSMLLGRQNFKQDKK